MNWFIEIQFVQFKATQFIQRVKKRILNLKCLKACFVCQQSIEHVFLYYELCMPVYPKNFCRFSGRWSFVCNNNYIKFTSIFNEYFNWIYEVIPALSQHWASYIRYKCYKILSFSWYYEEIKVLCAALTLASRQ